MGIRRTDARISRPCRGIASTAKDFSTMAAYDCFERDDAISSHPQHPLHAVMAVRDALALRLFDDTGLGAAVGLLRPQGHLLRFVPRNEGAELEAHRPGERIIGRIDDLDQIRHGRPPPQGALSPEHAHRARY
jgi:hypothetical protein